MNKTKIKEFLEKNKQHIGFADYKLTVTFDKIFVEGELALVTTDYLEKTIVVDVSNKFMKKKDSKQKNVLLHELWHGRYGVFEEKVKSKVEKVRDDEEEDMINDYVRALEAGIIK